MDKLLLTPKEATVLLGISRSKLYELLRVGTIESVKIGDCRRLPATASSRPGRVRRASTARSRCIVAIGGITATAPSTTGRGPPRRAEH